MIPFEFLIQKRPVSLQAKSRANLQAWKTFVRSEAAEAWEGVAPIENTALRFTLVYLCNDSPADTDNIIKPIQDALVGLIFKDDNLISDVDSHRRFMTEEIDIINLPPLLLKGIACGYECVYVKVSLAQSLETYL
jgi:crossover junction endodeoxyribonuclease RusA